MGPGVSQNGWNQGKWRGFRVPIGRRWLYPPLCVGAMRPVEFPGEINTQNKNKGKINNCGFDPMRTEKRCWAVDVMAEVLTFHELCGRSTGRVIFQKPQLQDLPPATAVLAFFALRSCDPAARVGQDDSPNDGVICGLYIEQHVG